MLRENIERPSMIDMNPEAGFYPWFALQTRSRYENLVATLLRGKGYELFLPVYKSRRRWSDRIKELELPLFPGYLFCRFNPLDRFPILVTPGVMQVVGVGKIPIPVDDLEIAALETAIRSGLPRQPWPFLQIGQKVKIECKPLCGLEGILVEFKGRHRLVLSVTLLQRSVAVEVDDTWIRPIPFSSPMTSPRAGVLGGSQGGALGQSHR